MSKVEHIKCDACGKIIDDNHKNTYYEVVRWGKTYEQYHVCDTKCMILLAQNALKGL